MVLAMCDTEFVGKFFFNPQNFCPLKIFSLQKSSVFWEMYMYHYELTYVELADIWLPHLQNVHNCVHQKLNEYS